MTIKEQLSAAIYKIIRLDPFTGAFLQELNFKFDKTIPTAAIGYNDKLQKYELYFNTDFFQKLEKPERIAVLKHEVLHLLHKHIFRWTQMDIAKEQRMLWNVAADMAINQLIPEVLEGGEIIQKLPKGCIDVKNWKLKDGTPFPLHKSMENYYQLLMENKDANKDKFQDGKGEGPETLDEHMWQSLSDEEKERLAREARKLIQRTIEKTQTGHSSVPDYVNDFLKELDKYLTKLNYKKILQAAIKKTVTSQDRENSWKKPNKRYGKYAQGTSLSKIPRIHMYVDTSGSISYKELNQFLDIIDEFLKQGNKNCQLALWHTNVYYNKKYKLKSRLKEQEIQGGGTDPLPTLELIKKTSPDLAIILTDGYYSGSSVKLNSDVIWIISEGGEKEHAYKSVGKTIPLDGLKGSKK